MKLDARRSMNRLRINEICNFPKVAIKPCHNLRHSKPKNFHFIAYFIMRRNLNLVCFFDE